jgi:hypothetical protein
MIKIISGVLSALCIATLGVVAINELPASATNIPACGLSASFPWASPEGSGTAGSTYYELEISNISNATCTLVGFPSVQAVDAHGNRLGDLATHSGTPTIVTLAPDSTSHVVLRVTDADNLCPTSITNSTTLKLTIPGFKPSSVPGEGDEFGYFPLMVCEDVPSMSVSPVELGVGIPLYG